MFKKLIYGVSFSLPVLLSGCATDNSEYYLLDSFGFDTVCLADNRNVPPSFFIALRQAVSDKGLKVRTVTKTDDSCPATIYYEARYGVNSNALRDAKLTLIYPGHPTDVVTLKKYEDSDTLRDNLSDPEPSIRDMVNRLLPRSTPW